MRFGCFNPLTTSISRGRNFVRYSPGAWNLETIFTATWQSCRSDFAICTRKHVNKCSELKEEYDIKREEKGKWDGWITLTVAYDPAPIVFPSAQPCDSSTVSFLSDFSSVSLTPVDCSFDILFITGSVAISGENKIKLSAAKRKINCKLMKSIPFRFDKDQLSFVEIYRAGFLQNNYGNSINNTFLTQQKA